MFGVSAYPANGPLHFVRDLIILVLSAALLGGIIRTIPVSGLFGMAIIFGTNQDGDLSFRITFFIVFYNAGMAAIYHWNLLAWDIVVYYLACSVAADRYQS